MRRYVCAEAPRCRSGDGSGSSGGGAPPVAFALLRGVSFADPSLSRIYAVDRQGALVVAAGHGGRAALWSTHPPAAEVDDDENAAAPLLSWRAHTGWVCAAQLATHDDALRLLTAANDKTVALWDLSQQRDGAPRRLALACDLHAGGIWGMHAPRSGDDVSGPAAAHVWTCSKDGTTRLSALTAAGITPGRAFMGHHAGVIRAVRARAGGGQTAADGGADGCVCVLDARAAAGVALEITRAHPGAVNALEWHPCSEHVLLSAGSDPSIRLWDVRSAAQPLHTLTGHAAPHLATLRAVYRPAFVAAGAAVRA